PAAPAPSTTMPPMRAPPSPGEAGDVAGGGVAPASAGPGVGAERGAVAALAATMFTATGTVLPPASVTRRSTGSTPGAPTCTTSPPIAFATGTPSLAGGSVAVPTWTARSAGGLATATTSLPTRGSSSTSSAAAVSRVLAYLGSVSALAAASRTAAV